MRFRSRGPSELFDSDTSPKCSDREGLGKRRAETRKEKFDVKIVNYDRQIIFVFGVDEEGKILRPRPILAVFVIFFIQLFPNWTACSSITYTNCCIDVDILYYYVPSLILTYV